MDAGRCLLEWDGPEGSAPPAPLLKDMFAVERRKAKVRLTRDVVFTALTPLLRSVLADSELLDRIREDEARAEPRLGSEPGGSWADRRGLVQRPA